MTRTALSRITVMLITATSLLVLGLVGTAAADSAAASPCNSTSSGADGCVHLNMNSGARYAWYHYGSHNVNVSGTGVLINSQTGGAVAYYCTSPNGNGTCKIVKAGNSVVGNFSGIKSIYMSAKPLKQNADGSLVLAAP